MYAATSNNLWLEMKRGDAAARDQLVNQHLGLVYHAAKQLLSGLADDAEFSELVSAGTLGLLAAIDSFDTDRGVQFSTFAMPRIRGSILDELRRLDSRPRLVRQRQRAIAGARESLSREFGREPTTRELASKLDLDVSVLIRWESDGLRGSQTSLERPHPSGNSGQVNAGDALYAATTPTIDDELTYEQEVGAMTEALKNLSSQERTVIGLYFYKGLRLHEIAEILRLTESRVSQIRTKALSRMRAEMAPLRKHVA